MPKLFDVSEMPAPVRGEVWRLWDAFKSTPSDLVAVSGGFYLSFDAWCQLVLAFRLRPRPASLAVRAYLGALHARTTSRPERA